MADSERQMLDNNIREKLAHALVGRSDDYTLVMHCLHSFPEVITSQYCQIIESHHKHEEGLKMFVDGMVKEFKSKRKQYGDNASSMLQSIPEADGSDESGKDSSKCGEWCRFFTSPFIELGRAVIPNSILLYFGLNDTIEAVSSVHNHAQSGILSCRVDGDAQIDVFPHSRCENAEFCSEVRSLVVTETVERISLPTSEPVSHASSQIDRKAQDKLPREPQTSSSGLTRLEKLHQSLLTAEGPKRPQINYSGISRLEVLQERFLKEEPKKPQVGSSRLSRLERIQQSLQKDEGSKRSTVSNSGLSRGEWLLQNLRKDAESKKHR